MAREYPHQEYIPWALEVAKISGTISNFCDHREHLEPSSPKDIEVAAFGLQSIAVAIARHENEDLQELYANRIEVIEKRNPAYTSPPKVDGRSLVLRARTWRDLQGAQLEHNRFYHPDVAGLSPINQLRHYAFHVAKLGKSLVEQAEDSVPREDFISTRLPDIVIFRILLATAVNQKLPDELLPDTV